jgi:Ca2+-binding EF-hand superfamily protein
MRFELSRSRSTRFPGWCLVAAALPAAGCKSTPADPARAPRPDPRVELDRHHDEYWAYLAATYDADRDGSVARGEYSRPDESFARLDRDRDGAVTRRDFDRDLVLPPDLVVPLLLVRALGAGDEGSVALEEAAQRVMAMDGSGDGRVARAEFRTRGSEGRVGTDEFGTLLAGIDADRDGLISAPEIGRWLERRDADGDGRLALRERMTAGPAPREGFIPAEEREPAPDFVATALDGGLPVTLHSLLGERPLALIFGSYT